MNDEEVVAEMLSEPVTEETKVQEDDWSLMRKIDRLFARVDPCLVDAALSYLARKYVLMRKE